MAETGSGPVLAMGRVVGSLCVLTAQDGDAQGAMLASWVSQVRWGGGDRQLLWGVGGNAGVPCLLPPPQVCCRCCCCCCRRLPTPAPAFPPPTRPSLCPQASFDPPGLTVAVKRDRACESMLPVGASFVLNVLAEGKEKAIMKQMLKPFKPAEDRFAGMEVQRSEATGAVIVPQAAAYLECTVGSRMAAGDHYVVYAQVVGGKVLEEGAQSVMHFRKAGDHY